MWAIDNSHEIIFLDVEAGTTPIEPGDERVKCSADKVAAGGPRWFWIDTCSIDSKKAGELPTASIPCSGDIGVIARCYVYLTDILLSVSNQFAAPLNIKWEGAFRRGRLFRRGWILSRADRADPWSSSSTQSVNV